VGDQGLAFTNPAIEALAAQHVDLDLDHVEPAGMLGRIVKFWPERAVQDCSLKLAIPSNNILKSRVFAHSHPLLAW